MRWLLLSLVVLFVSIPMSCGETSIGGGPSISVNEKSSAQGAFMTDGANSKSSLVADAVKQISSFQWVQNARDDFVSHFIQVDNGEGVSYNQYGSGPGKVAETDYVFREEYLDVDWADYIAAGIRAYNSAGDESVARIEIENGYLTDYFNSGFAGPFAPWGATDGAFSAQSLGDAYGEYIIFESWAKDSDNDDGGVKTEITEGYLYSLGLTRAGCLDGLCYGSQSAGHEHPDGHSEAGAMLYGGYADALYGTISQSMYAYNYLGDNCIVNTYINKGYLINSPYSLWAYSISDWATARAVQYIDASSWGNGNYVEEFAWLNTDNWDINYYNEGVRFWDESLISPNFTGITHGYW